jgi:hypothetical protein
VTADLLWAAVLFGPLTYITFTQRKRNR